MNYVKYKISEKTIFILIATIFCLLLSLRIIPSIDSDNDTGRYVYGFNSFCQGEKYDSELLNKEISYNFFNSIFYPLCYIGSDRIFLFAIAFICPLVFLFGYEWKSGSIFWALSLLFSVYGIELMTNAMRQEVAMAIFFYSLMLLERRRNIAYILGILSTVAHSSAATYFPLIMLMDVFVFKRLSLNKFASVSAIFAVLASIMFGVSLDNFAGDVTEVSSFYEEIYIEGSSKAFNLFFISPLILIFIIRSYFDWSGISFVEKLAFIYSLVVIFICFNFFSAIVYRFALFSIVLQIYVVFLYGRFSLFSGGGVFLLMIVHLIFFIYTSKNYMVFIYG